MLLIKTSPLPRAVAADSIHHSELPTDVLVSVVVLERRAVHALQAQSPIRAGVIIEARSDTVPTRLVHAMVALIADREIALVPGPVQGDGGIRPDASLRGHADLGIDARLVVIQVAGLEALRDADLGLHPAVRSVYPHGQDPSVLPLPEELPAGRPAGCALVGPSGDIAQDIFEVRHLPEVEAQAEGPGAARHSASSGAGLGNRAGPDVDRHRAVAPDESADSLAAAILARLGFIVRAGIVLSGTSEDDFHLAV